MHDCVGFSQIQSQMLTTCLIVQIFTIIEQTTHVLTGALVAKSVVSMIL